LAASTQLPQDDTSLTPGTENTKMFIVDLQVEGKARGVDLAG
jgi:hypothetical protein